MISTPPLNMNKEPCGEDIKIHHISFGVIVIGVEGLMLSLMSYYCITIHTTFPRLIYIYRSTSILKKGCM